MTCYWYRLCQVCEQGRLFVKKRADGGSLYLLCEECFCVFNTPEKASDGSNCQEGMGVRGSFASQEDIAAYGWSEYPFNEVS